MSLLQNVTRVDYPQWRWTRAFGPTAIIFSTGRTNRRYFSYVFCPANVLNGLGRRPSVTGTSRLNRGDDDALGRFPGAIGICRAFRNLPSGRPNDRAIQIVKLNERPKERYFVFNFLRHVAQAFVRNVSANDLRATRFVIRRSPTTLEDRTRSGSMFGEQNTKPRAPGNVSAGSIPVTCTQCTVGRVASSSVVLNDKKPYRRPMYIYIYIHI